MKKNIPNIPLALTAILFAVAPVAGYAATLYVDQNGPSAGFWDGATSPVVANLTTSANWTASAAGTTATTAFVVGDNIQIGNLLSDFNGASIIISNDFSGAIGASPSLFVIAGTNATVTFLGTTANERYSHPVTFLTTNGATLNISGNNYNYNNQLFTFIGAGSVNVSNVLGNNETTQGIIVNMSGGRMNLFQNSVGTFGNSTAGHGFTLTNGTLNFVSSQSFADVFGDFQSGSDQLVKFNGGSIDNLSGAPGTINVNLGSYGIGGSFTYVGSSQPLSLGIAPVLLTQTNFRQIKVTANTLTIGGAISDNGSVYGLGKAGNGTLAMLGANTYSGPTTVSAGQLIVTTLATGNGIYTNGDGATLTVKPASPGQTLPMSSLTLGVSTGGVLQFDVGALGNPAVAPINLGGGALTANGANQIGFASISAVTNYPLVMPLIAYGTAGGNLAGLTLGAFPVSSPPYQGYVSNDVVNRVIDVVLTNGFISLPPGPPVALTWLGGVSGNWDTTTFNWITSGVATNYSDLTTNGLGDTVTFDDTVTGATNVILTKPLSPATITLNNVNSNYVFSGAGKITGGAALVLNNTGSLVLDNSGNNDFTGGVTINSGTLQLGNNDANGNPGTGPIINSGALVFNRTDSALGSTITFSPINGPGSVTLNGSGTVTFDVVEPYTGPTVVNAGTLGLSGPNSNPSALSSSSGLTINNGGIVQFQSDNAMGTAQPGVPITVNSGGVLTGLGTADGGVGPSSQIAANLTLNGGTLAMAGAQNNLIFGAWDLNGGVTVPGASITATISALTVVPSESGGTVFNVTGGTAPGGIDLNVTGTFINGTTTHDTGIIKTGTGTMVLDNNNTYAAGTTVSGGVLQLGASVDAAALTAPVGRGTVYLNNPGSTLKFASGKGVSITNTISDDNSGTVVLSISGTNFLSAANTYYGQTIIGGGALVLTNYGTINSSALISVSNATLDVSAGGNIGSSGSLSLTNSTLNLGTNLITSINSLAMSNSTVIFPSIQGVFNVQVAGALVTGGITNVIQLTVVPGQVSYPADLPLIRYGSFANVTGGNVLTTLGVSLPATGSPAGYLTNNAANNSIDLILTSDSLPAIQPITWNGQANGVNAGNWDVLTTSNWLISADGVTAYRYLNGSPVTFDDTAHGTTSVNLTTNVQPAGITINNTSKPYVFSGTGGIGGGGSLLKTGTGTATFTESGADNFIGGINVDGGMLVLSNASAAIGGGIAVNGGLLLDQHGGTISGGLMLNAGSAILDQTGTLTGGTVINPGSLLQVGNNDAKGSLPAGTLDDEGGLTFNRSDNALNVATLISGGGSVTNAGSGAVTLSATNTFSGGVTVNSGTVLVNSVGGGNSALGSGAATVNVGGTLTGGGIDAFGYAPNHYSPPVIYINGGTVTELGTTNYRLTMPNLQFNGGTLTSSPTNSGDTSGNYSLFGDSTACTVTTIASGSMAVISAGSISFQKPTTFNVDAGTTPAGIDLLITAQLLPFTNTTMTVTKTGAGAMALDASSPIARSPITVSQGTLQLGTASDTNLLNEPMGYGPVTLDNAGTTLSFDGRLGMTVTNAIGDDGGSDALVVINSGTNTLLGANTYTAPTVVSNGVLIVNGSLAAASLVTVVNGTLGGSGTIGGSVVNSGTVTAGTTTSIGTLTCLSSVLNNSSAACLMKLNAAVSPSNDVLNVAGTLTYGGALNVISLGGIYAPGETFQLFSAGVFSGSFSATNLPSIGPGLGLSWNPANGTLTVIQTVNTSPTNITAAVVGSTLNLSWPADHTGWRLLVQTNSLSVGLNPSTNAWFTVLGSSSVNTESITMDPTKPTVFYRMVYP